MIKYHPDTRFLTDYASGSLPWSQAMCVALHLHYCSTCENRIKELSEVGAALFMAQEVSAQNDEAAFERLMQRIDQESAPRQEPAKPAECSPSSSALPPALDRLTAGNIDQLPWQKFGASVSYAGLGMNDPGGSSGLIHIKAGGSVPRHRHGGDEITVVLKGSFSDHDGHYQVGDFIHRSRGEKHRPVASQHEDCLCFTTLEAPIIPSNWLLRLLQPLFNPRLA